MEWLKTIHVSCVILSFSGFVLRGIWMLNDSPRLKARWSKVLPHLIDTALLISALLMLYVMNMSVLQNDWLIAKISALFIYILLGMVALKYARTKKVRGMAWFMGLIVFIYIASVALTKSIAGFLIWIY